jgi:hypothetical protein
VKLRECLLTDQIFTHIDTQGVVRHFNADAIWRAIFRKELLAHAELRDVQLTPDLVAFIESSHGIEQDYLKKIAGSKKLGIPMLLACFPEEDSQCVIDGNHRAVANARTGKATMPAIWVQPAGWQPYLVEGMPDELASLAQVRAQQG